MPLEIWLLFAYPLLMGPVIGKDLFHLRSLLLAAESLKAGVITISDCFFDPPRHELDRLGTVFGAYDLAGIRAIVTSGVMNMPTLEALPFTRDVAPSKVRKQLDFGPPITAGAYIDYCRAAIETFDGRAGRLKFTIAPDGIIIGADRDIARFQQCLCKSRLYAHVSGRGFRAGSQSATPRGSEV